MIKKIIIYIITFISIFFINDILLHAEDLTPQKQLVSMTVQQVGTTPLIIDLDMSTDADDVIAVRIAQQYDNEGLVDLKAIMLSVNNELDQGHTAAEGIMDAYGFYDVMVGTSCTGIIQEKLPYWGYLTSLKSTDHITDTAIRQYRRVLASYDGGNKVAIIITGYFGNLYRLISSPPDDISPYTGLELIKNNVKFFLVCGAGKGKSKLNGCTGFENNSCMDANSYKAAGEFYKYIGDINIPIYQYNEDGTMAVNIIVGGKQNLDINDPAYKCFAGAGYEDGRFGWDAICTWLLLPILSNDLESYGISPELYSIISTDNTTTRFKSIPSTDGNVTILNMSWSPKMYLRYINDAY